MNSISKKRTFRLWHSLLGTIALLAIEALLIYFLPGLVLHEAAILVIATIGIMVNVYVSAEVIEEVRGARNMFVLLSYVVAQLVVFFAFEYFFLFTVQPASFPSLTSDPLNLLLHSVMIFVFNPIYLPATDMARALVLINTLGSLVLVLFILQNIGELRKKSLDTAS
jgi:hypothetical protein